MSQLITEEIRAKAEVYQGDEICQVKSKELLLEINLPNGLLPLKDIEECGYHRESGFVWLKQKAGNTHKFEKVDRQVTYGTEVTAYVEVGKIKKLTGVKVKELLVWLPLHEIELDNPPTGKITFRAITGLFRTFPASAFELEDEVKDEKEENKDQVKEAEAPAATATATTAAPVEVNEV
ncbi:uncharacterized protein LOC123888350 [Trifolium pratense]|uniref:uncharacterized protein LOC123888350 n=1 Tax=Trifolium pratense TaxID=57577 RepID=UPI001E6975FF|nr:uncharacterized protein LOC123888350 [Trifolium pratense]